LPILASFAPLHAYGQGRWRKTKTLRTEYNHMTLQFHDCMKLDADYRQQRRKSGAVCGGQRVGLFFRPHAACRDVRTIHAGADAESPAEAQYDPAQSPLAILQRLAGRPLA
jgi:hypothetical protein